MVSNQKILGNTTKHFKMEASRKQEIKARIKEVIEGYPKMPMILEVGLMGSKLSFLSRRAFRERVRNQIEQRNVHDIIFEGIGDSTLQFKTMYHAEDNWNTSRGYGQGKNMGD